MTTAAPPDERGEPRLLIAGHSLGFFRPVAERARLAGATVREDRWRRHGLGDKAKSGAAAELADVIHCEWCLGNAVWHSRKKRPEQRLVVRFHRMELETDYPGEVALDRVDAMVFVAAHVLRQACERFGWDPADPRFQVIPNGIEIGEPAAAKLPGARFNLGVIGYVPRLKRLDRALDLLELLRRHDERYRLLVKGRPPWEYAWMATRERERGYYEGLFERIGRSPLLRRAVRFEPYGDDVDAFLRQVGWIVSASDVEGHPVAVAEGMASGAVPVVLDRPGAREQFEPRWVHADAAAAALSVLTRQEQGESRRDGEAARQFSSRWSWERLWPAWETLLACGSAAEAPGEASREAFGGPWTPKSFTGRRTGEPGAPGVPSET